MPAMTTTTGAREHLGARKRTLAREATGQALNLEIPVLSALLAAKANLLEEKLPAGAPATDPIAVAVTMLQQAVEHLREAAAAESEKFLDVAAALVDLAAARYRTALGCEPMLGSRHRESSAP